MTKQKAITRAIADPIFVMYLQGNNLMCHVHKPKGYSHEHYGLAICDLVRHVAEAFKVHENAVWEWIDRERAKPTDTVIELKGFDDPVN